MAEKDALTLPKLDRVIEAAVGWTNSHLHEFTIEGRRYGIVDPGWDQEPDLLEDKRFRVGDMLVATALRHARVSMRPPGLRSMKGDGTVPTRLPKVLKTSRRC